MFPDLSRRYRQHRGNHLRGLQNDHHQLQHLQIGVNYHFLRYLSGWVLPQRQRLRPLLDGHRQLRHLRHCQTLPPVQPRVQQHQRSLRQRSLCHFCRQLRLLPVHSHFGLLRMSAWFRLGQQRLHGRQLRQLFRFRRRLPDLRLSRRNLLKFIDHRRGLSPLQ